MEPKTRKCNICGATKPLDLFPVNPHYREAHLPFCKECASDKCNAIRFVETVIKGRGLEAAAAEIARDERKLQQKKRLYRDYKELGMPKPKPSAKLQGEVMAAHGMPGGDK